MLVVSGPQDTANKMPAAPKWTSPARNRGKEPRSVLLPCQLPQAEQPPFVGRAVLREPLEAQPVSVANAIRNNANPPMKHFCFDNIWILREKNDYEHFLPITINTDDWRLRVDTF